MTLADWEVDHGTAKAEKWHYRHGQKPCTRCAAGRSTRSRATRTYAVHADRGDGTPVCGASGAQHVANQDVTCARCRFIAGGGMAVMASGKRGAR